MSLVINRIEAGKVQAELAIASDKTRSLVESGLAGSGGNFGIRKSGAKDYERTFSRVLPIPLDLYIERCFKKGSDVVGLDLMGEAQPLRDLNIKGLGVTLVDDRDEAQVTADREKGIEILATKFDPITGRINELCDVFLKTTRRQIRRYLRDNQKSYFDIILCRPVAALDFFPDYPPAAFYLLQEFWGMLNPKKGLLATQVPLNIRWLVDEWRNCLSDPTEMRLENEWSYCAMSLIRNPKSEARLPALPNW